ncbi:MAG: type II CAAX endopeptidase family protein [Gemmatimonadota bacterium]
MTVRDWISVIGAVVGSVLIVVFFNLLTFGFFLVPPWAAFLWVAAVGAFFLWWHGRPFSSGAPRRLAARIRMRPPEADVGALAGLVLSTVFLMLGAATLIQRLTGPLDVTDSPFHEQLLTYIETPAGWLVFAFAAGGVVPMIEEFAFRGRLQRSLERRFGAVPAVVAAAAVFAAVHLGGPHPLLLGVPFLMGLLCGTAVILTRSIWTAVLLHGVWNLLMTTLAIVPEEASPMGDDAGWIVAAPLALTLMGLGGWGWSRFVRRHGRKDRPPLPQPPPIPPATS